jgi:hypothetical protein
MNSEQVQEIIGSLSFKEIAFLNKLCNADGRLGYPSNTQEFGVTARLHEKKLITPYGKSGKITRWLLDDKVFLFGRRLIKEIGGENGQ